MDLLMTYAQQVVSYHPAENREELSAEIYDNLCEEYSDWRATHEGAGQAQFLDECKEHPMKYATRLAEGSAIWLIGPQFYFSFISALKIGASITTGFYLVLAFVLALMSDAWIRTFMGVLWGIPLTLLWVSAAILGVFVALEKSGERASWLDQWSAKDLSPLQGTQPISRTETLFDLGISTFGLLWVLGILNLPLMVVRHDGNWITDWASPLPDWFWWLAGALLVFDIGYSILRLFRNQWSRQLRVTTIVTNLAWIALLSYAVSLPKLVLINGPVDTDLTQLLPLINKSVDGVLLVICAVLAWDTLTHVWRLLKDTRKTS